MGNAAIAGIERENAISERKQHTTSLLAADNPNSPVNPVAAFLSGPYANTGNDAEALAGYNPFNGPLLASADGYSTYAGVYGPPGYGSNNTGPSVVAGQSDTEIVEIDGKKYRATFTVGEPESLDASSEGGGGMPGQTGDITDSMSPLQMQVMDTDPNSPQYADLQQQLYTQQWMQAFNNNDPGTMGLIETEESLAQTQQAIRNGVVTDGFMSAAPDPNVQRRLQDNVAAWAGGPFVALSIGTARYFGASEQAVQYTGEMTFNTELGIAGGDALDIGEVKPMPDSIPDGVTFQGSLYRAVGQGSDPTEIGQHNLDSSYRYTGKGEGGLYFSSSQYISESEILNNGGSMDGKQMWLFTNSQVSNLLDLTDPAIRENWGVTLEDLTRTGGSLRWRYEFTQPIGTQAKQMGYRGIIAPSAQADGGVNVILFGPRSSH